MVGFWWSSVIPIPRLQENFFPPFKYSDLRYFWKFLRGDSDTVVGRIPVKYLSLLNRGKDSTLLQFVGFVSHAP